VLFFGVSVGIDSALIGERMNRTGKIVKITGRAWPLLLAGVQIVLVPAFLRSAASETFLASTSTQKKSGASTSTRVQRAPAARCQIIGSVEIKIACDYSPAAENSEQSVGGTRIALNHAALSFRTKYDGWTSVVLTFTKLDQAPISEQRLVYLAVDDDSGHNFIRRLLPSVDFRPLTTGQRTDFSERLLMPALRPGHYRIELWIPSSDPSLKFDKKHNFLLSGFGVTEKKTGLNRIAEFSVSR
jgi:hypothetical protein